MRQQRIVGAGVELVRVEHHRVGVPQEVVQRQEASHERERVRGEDGWPDAWHLQGHVSQELCVPIGPARHASVHVLRDPSEDRLRSAVELLQSERETCMQRAVAGQFRTHDQRINLGPKGSDCVEVSVHLCISFRSRRRSRSSGLKEHLTFRGDALGQ